MLKPLWLKIVLGIVALILIFLVWYAVRVYKPTPPVASPSAPRASSAVSPSFSPSPPSTNNLSFPIADFKSRVTKKPFGIYITLQNSPVQPERFSGYHTGADVEYEDISTDVPIYALADGTITYSNWVSGYGGVLIIKVDINGTSHSVLYGHLRPTSLPAVGATFKKGDQTAVLGTGFSHETDGERRHLHFSVLSNARIDVKGYVQTKAELSSWIDPLTLYN